MNRRFFLRLSPAFLSLPYLNACNSSTSTANEKLGKLDLTIFSDRAFGHLITQENKFSAVETIQKDILIVGGGIAGMTALHQLKDEEVVLCELSDSLGGTAGAVRFQNEWLCQGAHYDLVYPETFGESVLKFMENLQVIQYEKITGSWSFVDKQFMIFPEKEGRTWHNQQMREDIIAETADGEAFLQFAKQFENRLKLPTRLIDPQYHFLNQISLRKILEPKLKLSESVWQALDYQMLDDFGGTASQVSALAGIYYYASRPYRSKDTEVFSPPQGNYYFIQKLGEPIASEKIWLNHLVTKIEKSGKGFLVEVIDGKAKNLKKKIECKQIIYAANKHALKYVFPPDYPLFAQHEYAPWMVINLVLQADFLPEGFWQNEIISQKSTMAKSFLGFVDSDAQYHLQKDFRTLTTYFCFPPNYRKTLQDSDYQEITQYAIREISQYFKVKPEQLYQALVQVLVKVMGHAMAIPKPDFLFADKNTQRREPNLVYAGVDNSRLPLMLEAMDSGLEAVRLLKMNG
ncbi:MAG: FAD-dependent oxidoreductase [Microscillaceae bacterium]|jgi:protoporphyrinogen oxidase|nr:FAD-dependent oxidoreductase [Microscillaceae bacterium]